MRKYEDLKNIRVNALPPRCYYIPENEGCKINLNGTWGFNYYEKEVADILGIVPKTVSK